MPSRVSSYMSSQSDNSATVRKRFSSGSYIISIPGVLKFLLIVIFLVSGIIYVSSSRCPNSPDWDQILFPAVMFSITFIWLVLYAVFLLAIAKRNLDLWALLDVVLSSVAAILVVVICILSITNCSAGDPIHAVPAPVALAGAIFLAANAAATYIMWKYQKVPAPERPDFINRMARRFTIEA
ncbi:uncharacterized protein LOC132204737 [Neocloeon triangulifer]|uniref:uncharacterized protein LOC132204737 n=1 Tax=Neocloeon triangulifer TaxID=2078957 RepID=UPI00286F0412|nr:uncharacterized protein LOC132204737 [Neocloeon triangulifer]